MDKLKPNPQLSSGLGHLDDFYMHKNANKKPIKDNVVHHKWSVYISKYSKEKKNK